MLDKNNNIRLIDFGFSQSFQSDDAKFVTSCGTPAYMSPEVIQGKPSGIEADIWSLGIILYEMVLGKRPFIGSATNILSNKIISTEPNYSGISDHRTNLLVHLLKKNPCERLKMNKIKNYYKLHEIRYDKFLSETLEIVMKKEVDIINYDLGDNVTKENKSLMMRLLSKEIMTDLIECLNQYIRKPADNKSDILMQIITVKKCGSAFLPNSTPRQEIQTSPRNRERRAFIQQHILNAQHAPIHQFAFTMSPKNANKSV
jgi:serine/threonine protein kinase